MDKIHFLLNSISCLGTVSKISAHIIKLEYAENLPEEIILLSGFDILNENDDSNMSGDYYHGYTTIYKSIDSKTVLLSNDGSIYSGGSDIDVPSVSEPSEPYVETLEDVKLRKISELSEICYQNITNGIDVEIDGSLEHFSYNEEDQINIKELFDLTYNTNCNVWYHADGNMCKEYTSAQFIQIYSAEVSNKMHHTTYFNQLKLFTESLTTIEEVNKIEYNQLLTGIYLDTYDKALIQTNDNLIELLSKRYIKKTEAEDK